MKIGILHRRQEMERRLRAMCSDEPMRWHVYPILLDLAGNSMQKKALQECVTTAFTNMETALGGAVADRYRQRYSRQIVDVIVHRWEEG